MTKVTDEWLSHTHTHEHMFTHTPDSVSKMRTRWSVKPTAMSGDEKCDATHVAASGASLTLLNASPRFSPSSSSLLVSSLLLAKSAGSCKHGRKGGREGGRKEGGNK